MAKFTKFEDIGAWQKARSLSKKIYPLTDYSKFNNDFALIRQMRRSAGSIMDNIAEGFGRGGNKEFIHFLQIALGSSYEFKSQLYRATDQMYITEIDFKELYTQANEIGKMINGLLTYLKKSRIKGSKFKTSKNENSNPTKN